MDSAGWLKKFDSTNGDVLFKYSAHETSIIPTAQSMEADKLLTQIGLDFKDFVKGLSPLSAFAYASIALKEMLIRWVVEKEAYDRAYLVQAANESSRETNLNLSLVQDIGSDESYLCARFATYCIRSKEATFDRIVRIAGVARVTEVVVDTASPSAERFPLKEGGSSMTHHSYLIL